MLKRDYEAVSIYQTFMTTEREIAASSKGDHRYLRRNCSIVCILIAVHASIECFLGLCVVCEQNEFKPSIMLHILLLTLYSKQLLLIIRPQLLPSHPLSLFIQIVQIILERRIARNPTSKLRIHFFLISRTTDKFLSSNHIFQSSCIIIRIVSQHFTLCITGFKMWVFPLPLLIRAGWVFFFLTGSKIV